MRPNPASGGRTRVRHLLVVLLALAACDSTPRRPESGPEGAPVAGPEEEGEKVAVPRRCLERLAEFVNREQFLLADHVVIEASSDPFFMAVTATADPSAVEKTEGVDAASRTSVLSLRNRTDLDTVENVLPQLRVGDGFRIVGTRDILARFHNRVTARRPVWATIQARGRVVYYDSHSGRRLNLDAVTIRLEIAQVEEGYIFRSRVE